MAHKQLEVIFFFVVVNNRKFLNSGLVAKEVNLPKPSVLSWTE